MNELAPIPSVIPVRPHRSGLGEFRCGTCRDRGLVFARRIDVVEKTSPYVFRCSACYRGENDHRAYPAWDSVEPGVFERIKGDF